MKLAMQIPPGPAVENCVRLDRFGPAFHVNQNILGEETHVTCDPSKR